MVESARKRKGPRQAQGASAEDNPLTLGKKQQRRETMEQNRATQRREDCNSN